MAVSLIAILALMQGSSEKPSASPPRPLPLSPLPSAPPPPPLREPASPRAPLVSYFATDDYPVEALRNDEEGVVGFRLDVGPDGRVGACTVTSSSDSASLDEATCRILRSRARFTPARGFDDRPRYGVWSSRITWRLSRESAPAAAEGGAAPAVAIVQRARPIAPLAALASFRDFPSETELGQARGRSHFRLAVDPSGRVTDCEVTFSSEVAILDATACALMRSRARFAPARDAAGNAVPDNHWGHITWRGLDRPPLPDPPPRF